MDQSTQDAGTGLSETRTFSFVIKIWIEETVKETGRTLWRGHIAHVPDGERRYIQALEDIPTFVALYLEEAGVRIGPYWRFRRWLKRR